MVSSFTFSQSPLRLVVTLSVLRFFLKEKKLINVMKILARAKNTGGEITFVSSYHAISNLVREN